MRVNTAFNCDGDGIFTRKIVGGKASIWRETITPFIVPLYSYVPDGALCTLQVQLRTVEWLTASCIGCMTTTTPV